MENFNRQNSVPMKLAKSMALGDLLSTHLNFIRNVL